MKFLMFVAPCAAVITKPTIQKVTNAMKKPMTKLSVISAVSKVLTRTALTTAARITPMTDITELALLVSKAKASVFTLEYISQFEPADIDSDDVDLRFEVDGRDTGTNVSIVDECGQAAKVIGTLVEALEKAQQRIAQLESRTVTVKLPDIMPPEAAPAHYWGSGESMAYADGYNKSAADLKTSFALSCSSAGVNVEFE
ncbi:hypothetical protein [Klebsiella quasipneumoniae]|uniref:hypothetical protein n=1 Tax=Klebsiella quasipneumoniae TaxID=1463165 RepID=UPI00191E680E|nr:hypothetical protein [Klebsiella quasipneumoniae]